MTSSQSLLPPSYIRYPVHLPQLGIVTLALSSALSKCLLNEVSMVDGQYCDFIRNVYLVFVLAPGTEFLKPLEFPK